MGYETAAGVDSNQPRSDPIHTNCARSCELGSHCCPNECIFGAGKFRGVGILE